jgi:predicted transposase YdaD
MPSRSRQPDELDSPWKEALEHFLEPFLGLCFPQVHAGIDWTRGYESLDKELQQIVRDAKVRKRVADKLFKVWRKDGRDVWLLIHIEVQGQRDPTFPERMFVYHYRIYDRYRRTIVSLAALCDEHPGWRPDHFSYDEWGCKVGIWFPVVKILDYRGREAVLEQSANPFAAVILAQLKVLETRTAPSTRWQWKLRIVKRLYDRRVTREQVRQLFRVIDWMLTLPPVLENSFRVELERFEEERRMPYVTSVERLAREEGRQEGRQEGLAEGLQKGILALLKSKFPTAVTKFARRIRSVRDVERLEALMQAVTEAETLDEALAALR